MPAPEIDDEFNLSAITPGLIKHTLQKCSSKSTPGPEGITYLHLRKLPSTHHYLATLFSKVLKNPTEAPPAWFSAELKLISKNEDPSQPANFRLIAMTSVIPKLFHKILAKWLERYLRVNSPSVQKGFLSGINRTVEHIFSISSILENAFQHKIPLACVLSGSSKCLWLNCSFPHQWHHASCQTTNRIHHLCHS